MLVVSASMGQRTLCGIKNGASNKILSENPKAFFTHCFGHASNLVVGGMAKNVRFLKDSMDTTYKISNLIKKSPKRDAIPTENSKRYIVRITRI